MKILREKWINILFTLLAIVLIIIAILGDIENKCVVNMLYGVGGVIALLIVARAICLCVNRKKRTCCTSSKSTETCCKENESTETETCCKEDKSTETETCCKESESTDTETCCKESGLTKKSTCCSSGRVWSIAAAAMLLIAFVLLAIKSSLTCCRITWGILGAISLCALVCRVCERCKKGKCKN